MRNLKRLISVFLALVIAAQLNVTVLAAESNPQGQTDNGELYSATLYSINPRYADVIDESDLIPQDTGIALASMPIYYTDISEAASYIRSQLVNRMGSINVCYITTSSDYNAVTEELFDAALAHTGIGTEGDYISWQYGGWTAGINYYWDNGSYYYDISYHISYYTTPEQEQYVTNAVNSILNSMPSGLTTTTEIIQWIYTYICQHVNYDNENLNNDAYKLKYTAYAALADGKSVCQGYALLLYRMLLEKGIDCRIVTGYANNGAHAWNIIKIGSLYYNVDATWDKSYYDVFHRFNYYLIGSNNFTDHVTDPEYKTQAFVSAYPISAVDYDAGHTHTWNAGVVTTPATCEVDGVKTYTCTGCGTTKTETIGQLGHNYSTSWSKDADNHWHVCVDEGFENLKTDFSAHTWGDGAVTTAATCETDGAETYTCTECGQTKTEVIEKLGHNASAAWSKNETEHWNTCANNANEKLNKAAHTWDSGKVTTQPTGTTEGVKTYTCTVCEQTKTEKLPKLEAKVTFIDVKENAWFAEAVNWAVANGITNGVGNNKFGPTDTCTRAQVVTFLWRAAGKPKVENADKFTDVKAGQFYTDAVAWAVASGITNGVGNGKFDPNGVCTRAQIVTFLARYKNGAAQNKTNKFTDVKNGAFYADAVAWAVENKITTGIGNNKFAPNNKCSRSETVTFLYRAVKNA